MTTPADSWNAANGNDGKPAPIADCDVVTAGAGWGGTKVSDVFPACASEKEIYIKEVLDEI